MKRPQKVTDTSRRAFYANQDSIRTQRIAVAEFILKETKAGRWTWISKIADNAQNIGNIGLSQKSSASRALKELKGVDIILDGVAYVLEKGELFRPIGGKCAIEPWAMVLKK